MELIRLIYGAHHLHAQGATHRRAQGYDHSTHGQYPAPLLIFAR